ncbi:ribosomal maturation YjgA family protein [Streptomyces sp. SGAir0957]
MSRRWWGLVVAVVTVAAGLAIRSWTGGPFAKYAGDALYTVLVCAVVVVVAPRSRPVVAAGIALGFSWAVELLQIVGIPAALRPLLGATFNAPDLFWYVVGAGAGWCLVAAPGWRRAAGGSPAGPAVHPDAARP